MKKYYGWVLSGLVFAAGACTTFAAEPAKADPIRAMMEMRKNIAWTVEGLYQLGNSKERTLRLTPAQAKKLLPLYNELIAKKIIQLKLEKGPGERRGRSETGHFGGPPPSGPGGPPDAGPGGDPRQHQARVEARAALVAFGNTKMEAINRILTKKQVAFIDNWDFKAEKYGFPDFSKRIGGKQSSSNSHFGGAPSFAGGHHGNNPSDAARRRGRSHGERQPMDPKWEAGRRLLVKLNQDVLKMLRNYK